MYVSHEMDLSILHSNENQLNLFYLQNFKIVLLHFLRPSEKQIYVVVS